MTDTPPPAPMDVHTGKPGLLQRISFIWLVPFLALAISLGVAWQNYSNQGVLIEIVFDNGSGIKADETEIKYKDISVGKVEEVKFSEGLDVVLVHARIDQDIAPFLDADAQFWVVRPDVSVRGISGLDTVLSGVYIEGKWNNDPQVQQYEFVGLESPPIDRDGEPGTQITLRASDGSALSAGAPVLHKGIEVGFLGTPVLSSNGQSVSVTAFIKAPYDRRMTTNTRFWDTSGFSVSFGAGGLSLNVNSLASLIEGGIAYDTVVSGGRRVRDGDSFDLLADEDTARSSLFNSPDAPRLEVAVLFDGSVNGLTVGSDVRFQGLSIGEVKDLSAIATEDDVDGPLVQLQTVLSLEPGRMGLGDNATPDDALIFLADFVRQQNLRARLVTGNILSGALNVELIPVPDATPAFVDLNADPYPIVPTTTNVITDVADEAQGVLARINNLPIEELMNGAVDLMDSIEMVIRSDGVAKVPDEVAGLIAETRTLMGSDDIQAIPAELRAIVTELNTIVTGAQEADLVGRIGTVVDSTAGIVGNIETATANLPAITAEVEALIAKANALELDQLLASATGTFNGIDAFIASDGVQQVPAELTALLADARAIVGSDDIQAIPADLRGIVSQINSILVEMARAKVATQLTAAINSANAAAASIESASADLPAITTQLNELATKANELDLAGLVNEATATLGSINTLVGSDSTQDLPASLSAALDELGLFLAEVREGGAVTNVNAALASAADAARAIEDAAASLPALSRQATALVAQTDSVLQSYGERSRFNAETLATLRDIQEAADAMSALARAIQRNPNSLLTGR